MLHFYQNLPSYINPVAFTVGSFSIRWYALSYLVGFGVAYWLLIWRVKRGEYGNQNLKSQITSKIRDTKYEIQNTISDFLLIAFFSSLIGGRIGYVLFYDLPYFLTHPLTVISPYDSGSGKFVGIYGMSYHGALLGIIIGSWIFLRFKKIDFLQWADFVAPAAALGYFFGRVGNFLNGELYGRVTNSPLGMYFAEDNLLRHPSQLYEAILEGLVLFAILWKMRKMRLQPGTLFVTYMVGYGLFRILIEQFRQPDPQVGFLLNYLTLGQFLSSFMVVGGMIILIILKKRKQ